MKCYLYTSRFSRFANIFSYSCQFYDKCIAGFKPAIGHLRDFCEMKKTYEMRETHEEKRARTRYRENYLQTFRNLIIFSYSYFIPFRTRKFFVSCIITAFLPQDGLRCEIREICLVKQHKKHKITRTHVSRLAFHRHLANHL